MNLNDLNGTYRAKAVDAGLGKAGTGTEQVAVLFELKGDGAETGLRITWYGYLSEKAFERTIESLRYCGWRGSDLTELDNFHSSGLGENEVDIVIEQEPAQDGNGARARVRWVNAPGSGGIGLKSKLSPDEAKSFAQRMKAKILAMEQGKPRSSPPSHVRSNEPPPHTDSDRPPH